MHKLHQLTEQLASAVTTADPDDLPALAHLHDQLQSIARLVAESGDIDRDLGLALYHAAASSQSLVSRIILREVDDAAAALQQVTQTAAQLLRLVTQTSAEPPPTTQQHLGPIPTALPIDEPPISPDDVPLIREFATEALGHIESAAAALLLIEHNHHDPDALNALFRSFHNIKGVAGFLNLRQISALTHATEGVLELARRNTIPLTGPSADLVRQALDLLRAMIASLEDAIQHLAPPAIQPRLATLLTQLQDASAASSASHLPPLSRPQQQPAVDSSTLKVPAANLDRLINTVGRLAIAQSVAAHDLQLYAPGNLRLAKGMARLITITHDLHDLSVSMRMAPLDAVFQKMTRLIHDLARKSLKDIRFLTVGGHIELDRNVIDLLSGALLHLLRNAVDHGIERPHERAAAGKNTAGNITLRAYTLAADLVIEITDDGRGLDRSRILQKAVDSGIVQPSQHLDDQAIFRLIFRPGLTTIDHPTDISGRGVGMDIVQSNVAAIGACIDIASTPGRGTTFTIRLPRTLAEPHRHPALAAGQR